MGKREPSPRTRRHWSELKNATELVALEAFGYDARENDTLRAYRTLLAAPPEEISALRPELEATATSSQAQAAARVYAALVLRSVDEQRANELLTEMRGSSESCELAGGGCTIVGETLDEVVSHLLGMEPAPSVVEPRRLARCIESLTYSPVYVRPVRGTENLGARDFAELLETDLTPARSSVERLAEAQPPGALFGAVLLHRLDPSAGKTRLEALSRSPGSVRVVEPGENVERKVPVADIATDWLRRLGSPGGHMSR